jgi:hypothetical protein
MHARSPNLSGSVLVCAYHPPKMLEWVGYVGNVG